MTSHLFQTYGRRTIEFVKGTGTKVNDNDGKEYLDFTSGIGVCNLDIVTLLFSRCTRAT